ncbi:MAG: hypothetical protein NTZ72_00995, partial [Afipia sp.]|nr:hypothetical protein [Afipia sp.]
SGNDSGAAATGIVNSSDDDTGGINGDVRLPKGRYHTLAPACRGAKIDEEHLVFVVLDNFAERMPAAG